MSATVAPSLAFSAMDTVEVDDRLGVVASAVTVTIHSSTSDALYGSCTFNNTE